MSGYLFILLFLAVLWVFLIRPRQRNLRQQQRQVAGLEVDDEILTAGGLYGRVKALENDEVHLEIARGVTVRVARRAVAAVLTDKEQKALESAETAEPEEETDATLPPA